MANLLIIHVVENHFCGEPELAYRWLVGQGVANTEPGSFETLPEWVSRLSFHEVCELEELA